MLHVTSTVTSDSSYLSTSTTASGSDRATLQMLLEPFSVHGPAFDARFGSLALLVCQMLGTAPSALHTYAAWPLLVEAYAALLAGAKAARVGAATKRLVTVTAALVAQCAYCAALGCGLGDVFAGSVRVSAPLRLAPHDLAPADRKAVRLVVAATKVPARVSPQMQRDVEAEFGTVGLQELGMILGTVAFTNTLNSLLACELDEPIMIAAQTAFKDSLFSFGPHKFRNRMAHTKKSINPVTKFLDAIQVANEFRNISKISEVFMSKIPATHSELNLWLENLFGFRPRYLSCILDAGLKRAYCAILLKLVFWTDDDDDVSSSSFDGVYQPDLPFTDRLLISYVYMMGASNHRLALHFAFVAITRHGVDPTDLELALMMAQDFDHKTARQVHSPQEIMLVLAYYSARRYHRRMWRLSPKLFYATSENPATVMAFVGLTSMLTLFHRFSAVVEDGNGLEPEIADFILTEKAQSIGLDKLSHSSNSKDFDASTEELEIEWDDVDLESISIASASLRMSVAGHVWGGGVEY
ncbi:hypothetical protein BDR26DRAFT_1004392 [Obelidium mucronatum]|nr:hypothetical protein BDR26DRAFT_1004392 [Obelidium mucronatum]